MLGLGLGTGKSLVLESYTSILVKAFKARVVADIGIFEAESCLKTTLQNLDTL
jgi:hypothetical protein